MDVEMDVDMGVNVEEMGWRVLKYIDMSKIMICISS